MFLVAVTALFLTASPVDTIHVAPPDSAEAQADPAPIRVRPVLPLSSLYSGTFGIGLGAGIAVENAGWQGSEVTATAFGALHGYGASLTLASGDPYETPLHGLLHAEVSRATQRRFFGAGPFSDEADRLELGHTSATVEARVGAYPLGTTALIVQPSARLLVDRVDALNPETETALSQLDARSQDAARSLIDDTRLGLSLGLELATDRLDWHDYPSQGTYASIEARRYLALDDSDLQFTRIASSISGYIPMRGRAVLSGHAVGIVTRQDDDAVLPFVLLPTLDNDLLLAYATDRFRGRDALALALSARVPVMSVYGVYGLDAEITGTLGSVYADIVDQFAPSVSFDAPLPSDAKAPLRPAASLGLSVVNLNARSLTIGGRIGLSPEGISVALVSLKADLRDIAPLFR